MIFEPQKYSFIMQDAVYSLAVGFLCGFINRLLSCFLYKGRIKLFIKDVVMTVIFATLLFSYTVSFANYKVLRWYNVLFAIVGEIAFRPAFDRVVHLFSGLLSVTLKHIFNMLKAAVAEYRKEYRQKKTVKHQKNTQNSPSEPLQDNDKVLYN